MPLSHGKSKKAFQHNVKAEIAAGKPLKQALAIAYATRRRSYSDGGMVEGDSIVEHKPLLQDLMERRKNKLRGHSMPYPDVDLDLAAHEYAESVEEEQLEHEAMLEPEDEKRANRRKKLADLVANRYFK